jgi:CRP-like cAMP-binding protein
MNLSSYIEVLQLTDLFKSFSKQELMSLFNEKNSKVRLYKKNSVIHFESEKCLTLDVILNGELTVQRIDESGDILTITDFSAGDIIGGNILFGNSNFYPMSIIAKTDTIILHIEKGLILGLCQSNKDFLVEFLNLISERAFILTNKIKTISMKSLRECIIDFLNYEYYSHKNNKIKLNMTKKELAERLGVQRTSLSRELSKMRKDGLIDFDKHFITIKDMSIIK